MLYLDESTVQQHLPTPLEAVAAMEETLQALATGAASVTPKNQVTFAQGFANAMPAAWPERNLLGMKWVKIADNIEATILLDDPQSGHTRAVLAATHLTGLRTAAVTGATLRHVEPGATSAAFLGTGVQARSHAEILAALGYTDMYVWGRRSAAIQALDSWMQEHTPQLQLHAINYEELYDHKIIISGLAFSATGNELKTSRVRPDATLLPLDYGTVISRELAAASYLVADDPEQYRSLLPQKFPEHYPSTELATGSLFGQPRPADRLLIQNLGSGLGDVVLADCIVQNYQAHQG